MMQPDYSPASGIQRGFVLADNALQNRIIAVTGATGGLGTSLCKVLAQAGATVVLIGRKLEKLEKLYDVVQQTGSAQPAMITLALDTADEAECKGVAETLFSEFGRIDALVHCAAELGTLTPQPSIGSDEWSRVMTVNLHSARLLSLACLPLLERSEHASIVFLLDSKPGAYWGSYGISKIALQAFMHMLADETESKLNNLGAPILAVNGYDPGPIRTPLRRKAFPGELAQESPVPEARLGPLLALITRDERKLTGTAVNFVEPDTARH
jgi:NAD(P)-dependent dehydrogenase (short-subunit alcohol dehydrogenase family)